ncbi:rhodanese-like domain-containing protein [Terrisporobacter glycolicus]|uniref:Rhodanese domain-containing protein n=1 Tax=Terrisporobacter glycolicus ATCC 14880 = DSM 1288 TaxID=1121315 RepID=A0ABZ2EZZ7_9FIRM|nr:rhodanese-like domain-containing protein [Terrisporobacter glycolicus]
MRIFFKKYLIKYKDITDEITIDVRTEDQYNSDKKLQYNVPIINRIQYDFIHKYLIIAEIVIIYGLLKNIKKIKLDLLNISNNRKSKIVIACSKGRLRSPTLWAYAKYLGIDAKVLDGGVASIKSNECFI